ncbi:MAG: molecular chaperone TorD family protein [Propionibacteriaceae bacterium]|nr:molecular chaperone TorD family protein [Propionibacteriaceae bacterium]
MSSSPFPADPVPAASDTAGLQVIAALLLGVLDEVGVAALRQSGLPLSCTLDSDALARSHTKLFGGLRPGFGPPPPFESVWLGEHRVMGAATQSVAAAYEAAGAQLTPVDGLPADHVGYEVAFLAFLLHCHDDAVDHGDRAAAERADAAWCSFLTDHVSTWVPRWCQAVHDEDPDGFYGALASMLYDYVVSAIDELPGEQADSNMRSC